MDNYNILKTEGKTEVEKHGIKHTHRDYLDVHNFKKNSKNRDVFPWLQIVR